MNNILRSKTKVQKEARNEPDLVGLFDEEKSALSFLLCVRECTLPLLLHYSRGRPAEIASVSHANLRPSFCHPNKFLASAIYLEDNRAVTTFRELTRSPLIYL